MTTHGTEDLNVLSKEARELSREIAFMKRAKNRMANGTEKDQLIRDIKDKQYQALFYIEKIENIAKRSSVNNR